ncbi:peptide MFS transporter [Terricaulis sp.]|uniref:peptide MFS transporter n=1 Tax=Terricaulis sp. TaxID=2768686 RepID=UPI0037846209
MSTTETAGSGGEKQWFGHPRPLALLFTTEAWERFGYYGMRALLILYLVQHFVFADRVANGLYGAFTSLVYLTPLIGGFIADRYLGNKNAVKLGAVLMSAGYLMLAFTGGERADPFVNINGQRYEIAIVDGDQYVVANGQQLAIKGNEDSSITLEGGQGPLAGNIAQGAYEFGADRNPLNVILLFVSLGLVIVGNGYFKPNISTIVGELYSQTDRRRDAGFTIFYMGINLGSIFSQLLAPWIAVTYGYMWGFALAGFGMLLAAIRFQIASAQLKDYGNPPPDAPQRGVIIFICSLLAVPVIWFLMNNAMESAAAGGAEDAAAGGIVGFLLAQPLLGQVMFVVYILAMLGLPIWALAGLDKDARSKLIVAVVLCFFSVVFWTLFEQAGSSLTLFAERNTDRMVGSYEMPAGQAQAFNPIFIVIMAPLFSLMWNWLGKRNAEPSVPFKFTIALALVGIGFLALVFGAQFHNEQFQVALFWLALAYFIHSVGELCISPVGLSMITKLSPQKMVGLMMGVWFMSSAMAQYAGGIVAQFASTETVGGQVLNPEVSLNTYLGVFQTIGIAGLICAGILLLLAPFLQKGMGGIK